MSWNDSHRAKTKVSVGLRSFWRFLFPYLFQSLESACIPGSRPPPHVTQALAPIVTLPTMHSDPPLPSSEAPCDYIWSTG